MEILLIHRRNQLALLPPPALLLTQIGALVVLCRAKEELEIDNTMADLEALPRNSRELDSGEMIGSALAWEAPEVALMSLWRASSWSLNR
jgi:hypothetical protein